MPSINEYAARSWRNLQMAPRSIGNVLGDIGDDIGGVWDDLTADPLQSASTALEFMTPDITPYMQASQQGFDALKAGDYGQAAMQYGIAPLALAGMAAEFVPVGKGAKVAGKSMGGAKRGADLPMDEASRMARAREMGFDVDTPLYHGTNQQFKSFSGDALGLHTGTDSAKLGHFFTQSPSEATDYADMAARRMVADDKSYSRKIFKIEGQYKDAERRGDWDEAERLMAKWEDMEADARETTGQYVIPTAVRPGKQAVIDATDKNLYELTPLISKAKGDGFDSVRLENIYDPVGQSGGAFSPTTQTVVFDPKNIRSRFAAFDPAKANSADLLAGVAGAGILGTSLYAPIFADDETVY